MTQNFRGLLLCAALASSFFACGGTSGTDAGVDAGQACTFGTCGALGYCDATSDVCVAKSCSSTAQQPDVCGYGQFCGSYDTTAYKCFDIGGACTSPAVSWNAETSTGPVIYYAQPVAKDTTWCAGSTPAEVSVLLSLYYTSGTFAATGATFPSSTLYFVKSDGTTEDAKGLFRPASGYTVSADRKHLDLKLNFCGVSGASLTAGFYYTGGNEYCGSFAK